MHRAFALSLLAVALAAPRALHCQARGASALGELVEGLPVETRVLVIGAHPDDEDTRLIALLTKGHHIDVAYLSLTRGDGGQNLIGNELGEALGVIRTEELLAARRPPGQTPARCWRRSGRWLIGWRGGRRRCVRTPATRR